MITILVIDFGCPNVKNLVQNIQNNNCKVIKVLPHEFVTFKIKDVQGIILSGGPDSVIYKDYNITLESITTDVPILGICYGAQLIAKLTGGKVFKNYDMVCGLKSIQIDINSELYRNLPENINIYCSHNDCISDVSSSYQITSLYNNNRIVMSFENIYNHIYGVQFHPDALESKEGNIIIRNFIRICRNLI